MQKNVSGEKIKIAVSEQQITSKNKEMNTMDEQDNTGNLITANRYVKISEIGTQTSFPMGKFDTSQSVSKENEKDNQSKHIAESTIENSTVEQLKAELEAAKDKIQSLEEERLESEKRRAIEITSKYVPTSFTR
jgi:hypothetical protein